MPQGPSGECVRRRESATHLIGEPVDAGDLIASPIPDVDGAVPRRFVLVEVPGIHCQREMGILLRNRFQPGFGNRRPGVQIPSNSCGVRPRSGDEGLSAVQRMTYLRIYPTLNTARTT